MMFKDEFEYVARNGNVLFVEVEGEQVEDETGTFTELHTVNVYNETGEVVDTEDEIYLEAYEEAHQRDYELEHHSRDFDYFEEDVNHFLKTKH